MATYRFEPEKYHTTLGPHEPVLRIAPGDKVITTTVDARGADRSGKAVTEAGNPQTGPFFVEGAEPGDVLSVHFDRLWPNRTTGWSSTVIAPNVLDAHFVKDSPDGQMSRWEIDLEGGEATLVEPETKLGRLTLPLAPMLGPFNSRCSSQGRCSTWATGMPCRGTVRSWGRGLRPLSMRNSRFI